MAYEAVVETKINVKKLSKRDPNSWSALYERSFAELYNFARRRVRLDDEARELVAQTFEVALANAEKFGSLKVSPLAWLYGILKNLINQWFKHNYIAGFSSENNEDILSKLSYESSEDDDSMDWLLDESEQLKLAFSKLKKTEKDVLELNIVAGLTVAEVAGILGLSPGAVRVIKARALKSLRLNLIAINYKATKETSQSYELT